MSARRFRFRRRDGERGQGLVEFALLLPIFLILLLSMLDFGFAFGHNMTLEYATREGARVGSALAAGNSRFPCLPDGGATTVDNMVIAAVQRVLESNGSPVMMSDIGQVHIYLANSSGGESGPVNIWTYSANSGPVVDGQSLDFVPGSQGWSACGRHNSGATIDSIGVSITYTYRFITPLAGALRFVGGHTLGPVTLAMSDKTVMSLNPTNP